MPLLGTIEMALIVPSFAVVGMPNKGKSSVVATLAEESHIAIAPDPGTTRRAQSYTLAAGQEPLYRLIDTPGFQRARATLDWLRAEDVPVPERADRVRAFVEQHRDDPKFHDECELLTPILDGAGILYVVDGSKPFGVEYHNEMEILRWTGQPRMALINMIGEEDYVEEWRRSLGQFFSIVRVFDAVQASFANRVGLLRGFAELDQEAATSIQRAIDLLERERVERREAASKVIAAGLEYMLRHRETAPLPEGADRQSVQDALSERLRAALAAREVEMRRAVQTLYRHGALQAAGEHEDLVGGELFAEHTWQLFGLSRRELVASGAASGALMGGGVDLVLGGASLLLGAGLGAVIGGAATWFGGDELARVKVLGQRLGGEQLQVGPVRAPNLPWVVLGRAWLHHRLVSELSHAARSQMLESLTGADSVMDGIPKTLRQALARSIAAVRSGKVADSLVGEIQSLLEYNDQPSG